ncbi:PREDICTED: rho GTPase-activating protein gacZ-like [Ceratosolen solmsi marchali]|uniref:Rho GTPase-activating protein gacZ-like n=1 Tax=Ceratosolen solmsi marchali TaxID=326594 RepID=A0AAJ6YQV1_9HYME|nr:PREDICTED: rho GTPase-activating protein gacZ-like [Ceratosolen solmsi marchali]
MSDHDDTLLDEDLGDEEYDLGNDEEEALLADDYEFERLPEQQTICKGEEETDDVLDLGVTDALDDLEAEEENIQSKCKNDKPDLDECFTNKQMMNTSHEQATRDQKMQANSQDNQDHHSEEESNVSIIHSKIDLREKLREKLNNQREIFIGNGQGMEDDDCEKAKERRNRFQNERIMVPQKMNHDIPDSLENVVTIEQHRSHYRSRERGDRGDRNDRSDRCDRNDRGDRLDRRNIRGRSGGRYDIHQSGRYHGRGTSSSSQQTSFRAPLLENRPSFQPVSSNNVSMQHHQIYPHQNSQVQPTYHHPLANGPMPGHPHFVDSRLMPNQFPEPMRPQGPRITAPRIDYGQRSSTTGPSGTSGPSGISVHPPGPMGLAGIPSGPPGVSGLPSSGLSYNCSTNQVSFGSNQSIFSNHVMHMPERGLHPGTQGLLLPILSASGGPHISGNQGSMIPVSQGVQVQSFVRSQAPNPPTTHQNHPNVPNQPTYENRIQFSDPQFEGHSSFDSRNSYNNPTVNQFNNMSQIGRPLSQNTSQQVLVGITNVSAIPSIQNVPTIPTGHKILINPHFRGNQTKNEAKTIQDPADKFVQALRNASNSNARNNDPYSYFSDVWQESKSQRLLNTNSHRSYTPDNNYCKSSSYNNYDNKYKSESQWSHRDGHSEEHRSSRDIHRDKDLSPRSRSDQKNYNSLPNNSCYRNEILDHNLTKVSSQKIENNKSFILLGKEVNRATQKRLSDEVINKNTRENSPKRLRSNIKHTQNLEKMSEKTVKKEDEMDPEMKEYRKKMEEQKRLREKILREKENRRKLAAMEKQSTQLSTDLTRTENIKQETAITSITKENTKGKINHAVGRSLSKLMSMQSTEEKTQGARVIRTVQIKQAKVLNNDDDDDDDNDDNDDDDDDDGGKSELLTRIVMNKVKNTHKTLLQKNITQNSQKTSMNQTVNANRQLGQIRQLLTNSQRIVVHGVGNIQKKQQITIQDQKQQQQRQRIVVHKQPVQETKKIIKSNVVQVDNLAASTTETQIRRMCQGIGSIESIQMGEGNAIIVFKTQSAAMVFHKKYQRKMLDLSLIKVQLIPQTTTIKSSALLLKNSTMD